jgi:4a-hydroxytetrahydrobiopterin dehydratase
MQHLTDKEVKANLLLVPEWELQEGNKLHRVFVFDNFKQSIDFIDAVAAIAERKDHHPDIMIFYNKVELILSTHTAGGLTEKDFSSAAEIDKLA